MPERLRKMLSHSMIYPVGFGAQNVIDFVMLPIATRYLTPADFGTLGMMQIIIDLASLVFGAQLSPGCLPQLFRGTNGGG